MTTNKIKVVSKDEDVFEFLMGYRDDDNVFHREFSVTEMTGEEEEAISKSDVKQNGGKIIRTILERCITSIGTLTQKELGKSKWREVIQSLAVGDQDYALLKIREETLGSEIEVVHQCPSCKQELKTIVDTEDLEILPFMGDEVIHFELPRGYVDKDGNKHISGTLRFPNGLDREMLDQVARSNLGMANTMLLTRCIVDFEELKVYDQIVRKLGIKDRTYLLDLLTEHQFGVNLETEVVCPSCGHMFKGNMSASNFM